MPVFGDSGPAGDEPVLSRRSPHVPLLLRLSNYCFLATSLYCVAIERLRMTLTTWDVSEEMWWEIGAASGYVVVAVLGLAACAADPAFAACSTARCTSASWNFFGFLAFLLGAATWLATCLRLDPAAAGGGPAPHANASAGGDYARALPLGANATRGDWLDDPDAQFGVALGVAVLFVISAVVFLVASQLLSSESAAYGRKKLCCCGQSSWAAVAWERWGDVLFLVGSLGELFVVVMEHYLGVLGWLKAITLTTTVLWAADAVLYLLPGWFECCVQPVSQGAATSAVSFMGGGSPDDSPAQQQRRPLLADSDGR